MLPKLISYYKGNVTKTEVSELSLKLKCQHNRNVNKTDMSPKTEMSPKRKYAKLKYTKLKCPQNKNVTKT